MLGQGGYMDSAGESVDGPDAYGREMVSIEVFLSAALAWAKDSRLGQARGLDGEPSWRTVARFLTAGRGYE